MNWTLHLNVSLRGDHDISSGLDSDNTTDPLAFALAYLFPINSKARDVLVILSFSLESTGLSSLRKITLIQSKSQIPPYGRYLNCSWLQDRRGRRGRSDSFY